MPTPRKKKPAKKKLPAGQKTVGKYPPGKGAKTNAAGNLVGGRPPAWNEELLELIAEAISEGMTNEQAAHLASITPETLRNWLKSDEPFFTAIKRAVAVKLQSRIRRVEEGGRGWQAAAYLLERCYGQQFAPPKTITRLEKQEGSDFTSEELERAESLLKMM